MGQFARIPARDPFGALTQSLAVLGGAIRGGNIKKTYGGIRFAIPSYSGYRLVVNL